MPASSMEQPIVRVGTATTVSISTSAWTLVPAASSLSGRTGIMVNNPSSNTEEMVGILSSSSASVTEATTVRPLAFSPSVDYTFVPCSNKVYLWLLSLHTGAESVHVQEVAQV